MPRPNVILITTDTMRWDSLGAAGNPVIRTPNLDALASHGVLFSQAVVDHDNAVESGTHAVRNAIHNLEAPLIDTGYTCGQAGLEGLANAATAAESEFAIWRAREVESRPETPAETLHKITWAGNQAVRFCQAAEEPFCLHTHFTLSDAPPPPWHDMYPVESVRLPAEADDTSRNRQILSARYGAISLMDRQVGRMLATLTARGRTNNIIVFTAGTGLCLGSHAGASHPQPPVCDGAVRIPLLISGVLGQRKDERDFALATLSDIVPTVCDLLELDGSPPGSGFSLADQLHAAARPHRRVQVLRDSDTIHAIRTARYKWIRPRNASGEELYDLQADPAEIDNIGDSRQALAIRKMLGGLLQDTRR